MAAEPTTAATAAAPPAQTITPSADGASRQSREHSRQPIQ